MILTFNHYFLFKTRHCPKQDSQFPTKTNGNPILNRQVLLQCGVLKTEIPDYRSDQESSRDAMIRVTMVEPVSRYLRSCQQARKALRHVAEYTYVLLQDCRGGVVAQSVERASPGEEVPGSIPPVAARSLLVGSVSV